MSDTPRTDKRVQCFCYDPHQGFEWVSADFARELEEEANDMRQLAAQCLAAYIKLKKSSDKRRIVRKKRKA